MQQPQRAAVLKARPHLSRQPELLGFGVSTLSPGDLAHNLRIVGLRDSLHHVVVMNDHSRPGGEQTWTLEFRIWFAHNDRRQRGRGSVKGGCREP